MCRCCLPAGHRRSTVPHGGLMHAPSSGRALRSWQRASHRSRRGREVAVAALAGRSSRKSPLVSSAWPVRCRRGAFRLTVADHSSVCSMGFRSHYGHRIGSAGKDGPHVPSAKASIVDRHGAVPPAVRGRRDGQVLTRPVATTRLGLVGVDPSGFSLTAKAAVSSYGSASAACWLPLPNWDSSGGAPLRGTCHNAHSCPDDGAGIDVATSVTAWPFTRTFAGDASPARSGTM